MSAELVVSLIIRQNLPHGFEQVLGDKVWAMSPQRALTFEFAAPVGCEHEGRARARVARKLCVAVAVADHPAAREVELEFARGAEQKAGPGLAAVAVEPVWRLADRRVVR